MAHSEYSENDRSADPYDEDYAYYEGKKARSSRRRIGDTILTIVIIVIIIFLLLVLVNPGFREALGNWFNPPSGYREYPEWADYEVNRTIYVTPNPPGSAMDYEVDIPTPKDIPQPPEEPWLQDVKSVVSSPDRFEPNKLKDNYTWMVWEGDDVREQQILTIIYSIRTESAVWNVDPSESGTVNDIPKWLVDKYGNKTKEEWVILPAHPQIQSLSSQLTSGKITVYDKLKAIFDHLNDHFEYERARTGRPKYCNETLLLGFGDCDDQSVLFIALARAAGIPAWLEFGALYNQIQKSWGGHAWIRAYIPDFSGGGHVYNIDVVNDQFLFRDAYRFSEWESDGNGSHLMDYYYSYGHHFSYDEVYNTIRMDKSSKTIRIADNGRPIEESVPGFEGILIVSAIVFTALILRKNKRIKG